MTDTQFKQLVQKIIIQHHVEGKEQIYNYIKKDVYNLIYLIIEDSYEASGILDKACHEIYHNIIWLESYKDFNTMLYLNATLFAVRFLSDQYGSLFSNTHKPKYHYHYDYLYDDRKFAAYLSEMLLKNKYFIKELYANISKRKRIIFQLYCLADCTIEEISKYLGADKRVIAAHIGELRQIIMKGNNT